MNQFLTHFKYILKENLVTALSFFMFFVIVFLSIFGSYLAPYDPLLTDATAVLSPPSLAHPFGTDNLGRDVLSRVIVATRLDLWIAFSAVFLSFFIGSALGAISGFWGGWLDKIIGRFCDAIMAFPLFVLAMGIVATLGNSVENIIYATAIINLPFYARVTRSEVLIRRDAGYVQAAKLNGNSDLRILALQIFPNSLPPMMIQVSLNMGWAILNAAGLSFIGLGVRPPDAEWGIMVAEGATYIVSGEWWLALFPGLALMLAVFCFNLLGDGLRDLVDPKKRT
ncbi:ABC transporter permease [Halarcobacter ebronensis]|uniref:Peptide ABC transporter permease n=1 Tax=Halarcobacter ebronensis TaxID=1462615 RepID=A0A4Q1AZ85_9BACT|nr:ABC transporter permease [Halarcobacter ebronensis]QKF82503.1 nickel/dipeptide/oligopeptide ABC transporter, permease protein [Halarcobacter ebronensis]RXK07478.1 peptide ABC transporter permease [Halarcobacter ebronensis]